jgi:hypothetical protein
MSTYIGDGHRLRVNDSCDEGHAVDTREPFIAVCGSGVAVCECCGRFVGSHGLQLLVAMGNDPEHFDPPVLPQLPGMPPESSSKPLRCTRGCGAFFCSSACRSATEAEHCLLCPGCMDGKDDPCVQHAELLALGGETAFFLPLAARAVARAAARACAADAPADGIEVEMRPLQKLVSDCLWVRDAGGTGHGDHGKESGGSEGVGESEGGGGGDEAALLLNHGWRLLLVCLRDRLPPGPHCAHTLDALARLGPGWYSSFVVSLERTALPISAASPLQAGHE